MVGAQPMCSGRTLQHAGNVLLGEVIWGQDWRKYNHEDEGEDDEETESTQGLREHIPKDRNAV
jgi:hypothetical protein